MRIYKPTYTKPLPERAKIFTRNGRQFAKFREGEARLTKNSDKILCEVSHWHISFDDNQQIRRELKMFTDKQATRHAADRIEKLLCLKANNERPDMELQKWLEQIPSRIRDELIGFGLVDAERSAATKTLTGFLADFEKSMAAKNNTPKYINESVTMVKAVFKGCKFDYWTDILPIKVENYLKGLRDEGISFRRSNSYLTAIKSFCNWMVKSLYASETPLRHLTKLDVKQDLRIIRRAATPDEMRRLLEATRQEPERFNMTGYERSLIYKLAVETGLRKNEIRTLKVSSFDFDEMIITVETCYSKHRRKDVLPLRAALAAELKSYIANKLPSAKAFSLTNNTSYMIKADLKAARIPYKDADGLVFDFHALRHTFITNLRNVPTSVRQSLARHRSSAMTDHYTHVNLHDERAALDSLPDLSQPSEQKQQAVKTGTDVTGNFLSNSCFSHGQQRTNMDNSGKTTSDNNSKTHFERARQDSNLQPSDSKSATLSN